MTGSSELEGIVGEFLAESVEHLDQVDQDFVALEKSPGDPEILARVFRALHTIKGSCGFLEFPKLEALAHSGENLLGRLREGTLALDREITTALLGTVDAIRDALDRIGRGGGEGEEAHEALIARLDALREEGRVVEEDDAQALQAPAPDFEAVRAALLELDRAFACAGGADAPTPADALRGLEAAARPVGLESLAALAARAAERTKAEGAEDVLLDLALAAGEALATFDATGQVAEPDLAAIAARLDALGSVPAAPAPTAAPIPAVDAPVAPAPATDSRGDDAFRRASAGESTIRVDVGLLGRLMNQVGELVLSRNQILQHLLGREDKALGPMTQRLSQITTDLQESIMLTRLQPIEVVWKRFPRMVRDLALELDRTVDLVLHGADTELDRTLLEAIRGPMTHLVRNAIDHGIESAEEREAAGKSPAGTLSLKAWHEGGQVNIEIADDGKGIDVARLEQQAIQKGLVTPEQARSMSEREKMGLIFLPGFSTAERVTHVSGRGVGMDVVKNNIDRINGAIDVESRPGQGTVIRLKIPLTLAIMPALMVGCCGERYAIPQVNLLAVVRLTPEEAERGIERLHNARVHRWRGRLLPLVDLREELGLGDVDHPRETPTVSIVVLQAEDRIFGLVVGRVLDSGEIVVKPLGRALSRVRVFAGATIMGDGRAAMILDVLGLAQAAALFPEREDRFAVSEAVEPDDADTPEESRAVLLVRLGRERVAIPLSDAVRLERFPAAAVEGPDRRPIVQYRGGVLPLRRLEAGEEFVLTDGEVLNVVVHAGADASVGLLVDELLDIVTTPLETQPATAVGVGLVGTTVIDGHVAHVLDLELIAGSKGASA